MLREAEKLLISDTRINKLFPKSSKVGDWWASHPPCSHTGSHLCRPPPIPGHPILGKTKTYHWLTQRLGRPALVQTAPLKGLLLVVSSAPQLRSPVADSGRRMPPPGVGVWVTESQGNTFPKNSSWGGASKGLQAIAENTSLGPDTNFLFCSLLLA